MSERTSHRSNNIQADSDKKKQNTSENDKTDNFKQRGLYKCVYVKG